jgi:hypothetical protein
VNPQVKKFLVPFLVADVIFFVALALYLIPRFRPSAASGKAEIRVDIRHPESKLTEIDLVNNGSASGLVTAVVDINWPDADLVEAKALSNYIETETGRRSARFSPPTTQPAATLAPGQPIAIGWVKLTDDVPVNAVIAGKE